MSLLKFEANWSRGSWIMIWSALYIGICNSIIKRHASFWYLIKHFKHLLKKFSPLLPPAPPPFYTVLLMNVWINSYMGQIVLTRLIFCQILDLGGQIGYYEQLYKNGYLTKIRCNKIFHVHNYFHVHNCLKKKCRWYIWWYINKIL